MGSPMASAATCVMTVYVPVPRSCVPERNTAVPSGCSVAEHMPAERLVGYVAVAMPQPTSLFPRRIERGCGLRSFQPKRSAPMS